MCKKTVKMKNWVKLASADSLMIKGNCMNCNTLVKHYVKALQA